MSLQKPRLPGSIEDALARVCGVLGFDAAGAMLGHASGSRLRQCADPEQDAQISLRDAIRLDREYRAATGDAPLLLAVHAELVGPAPGAAPHAAKAPLARMLELTQELGETASDLSQAHADGKITPAEHAKLDKDLRDVVRAAERLRRDIAHAANAKTGGR